MVNTDKCTNIEHKCTEMLPCCDASVGVPIKKGWMGPDQTMENHCLIWDSILGTL